MGIAETIRLKGKPTAMMLAMIYEGIDRSRKSKSWNQNPNFFADFKAGKYKDCHPVTLEKLDAE